jgi:hypothetical protein
MPSIRIGEAEIMDAKRIQSFKASKQGSEQECVLTISTTDGKTIIIRGEMAAAALAILRLHGF